MTANQVQNDAPVDVAGRFTPCNLEIVKVYLSHLGGKAGSPTTFYCLMPKVSSANLTRLPETHFVRGVN